MKYLLSTLGLLLVAGVAPSSFSQKTARVLNMQLPVWVEHNGDLRALRPDRLITSGDTIVTGDGGRLLIDLPDAAALKVGTEERFAINKLREAQNSVGSLIEGIYEISMGAFRARQSAGNLMSELDDQGYPAEVMRVSLNGSPAVAGFTNRADAVEFLAAAESDLSITGAWVQQM